MEKTKKKKGSKPVELIKAFFGAAMLFCIPGLIITFIAPSFTIRLDRVSQERVDATVVKNILFLVPIFKEQVFDLQTSESSVHSGGIIREGHRSTGRVVANAEDEGVLLLSGQGGIPIEVFISPSSLDEVEEEILYFINESKATSWQKWVVSNWKFGAILPGGILLFSLVAFALSVWSILASKPLE